MLSSALLRQVSVFGAGGNHGAMTDYGASNEGLQVRLATSAEDLDSVYKLRYQVYCVERGFEKKEDYPWRRESDKYDPYSIHLLTTIGSIPVGTVRFIRPGNPWQFPIEEHCGISMGAISGGDRRVGEISRLAVSLEAIKGNPSKGDAITYALIRRLFHTVSMHEPDVRYVFAAMSGGLQRRLRQCGADFMRAGAPVNYHGLRIPCYATMEEIGRGMARHELSREQMSYALQYA
ncbi:MAG: GNAT family N-acetyltransferase [Nitrospirota bacterium]|nr:GNAT family N-acetyltransferase [Nitrospirota bacterium]